MAAITTSERVQSWKEPWSGDPQGLWSLAWLWAALQGNPTMLLLSRCTEKIVCVFPRRELPGPPAAHWLQPANHRCNWQPAWLAMCVYSRLYKYVKPSKSRINGTNTKLFPAYSKCCVPARCHLIPFDFFNMISVPKHAACSSTGFSAQWGCKWLIEISFRKSQ